MNKQAPNKMTLLPERSMGHQVRISHRAFDRLLTSFLAPHGLKSGYWYYLRALWQNDNVSQRELSQSINVTEATTVTMIAGMQKANLVKRQRDTIDKRKIIVSLTDEGKNLKTTLMPIAIGINSIATAGISKKDLDTCLSVLNKLNNNMHEFDANQS